MTDPFEPYRHHIARLQADNAELREILQRQKTVSAERYRALRAQLNEGLDPRVHVLQEENKELKQENSRLKRDRRDAVRESRGLPPRARVFPDDETDRALRAKTSRVATTEVAARVKNQIVRKLRGISIVLNQVKVQITWLIQHPAEFSPEVTAELIEVLEMRREELRELEAMMRSVPASAEHRGIKSYRPVPSRRGTI